MISWIKSSFRNRIFVTVLLVTLLPMLLCDVFVMQIAISGSENMLRQQATEELGRLEEKLKGMLEQADEVTEELAESTVVRSALRRGGSDSRLLYQFLYQKSSQMRDYAVAEIYDGEGRRLYSSESSPGELKLPTGWGALRSAGETQGLSMQADSGSGLSMSRAVRSYDGGILGYILVRVSETGFDSLLGDSFSSADDVFLLDGTWRQIYSSDSIHTRERVEELREALLSGRELGDGYYSVYLSSLGESGFTLALRQPRIYTPAVMTSVYYACLMMGLLCLVLSLVCAWMISRYLSKPVKELDEAMGRVEKGDYEVELISDRSDEMGRLSSSFNRMTREYRQNLERSVQHERELNETELSMLQAQLNPHFLYNTLDSMKWLGVTNHVPQVAAMATGLAALLRAGISGDKLIPLEQELELLEKYLDIQSVRFEDRFTWETDIDESFQHCLVPKLILQPLVENAIIHGVANMDDGYIKLSASAQGDTLILAVEDNGQGIAPEILEKLKNPEREMPAGHLGLRNVDRIVRLYYGREYGISARSEPGRGSRVELRLPMSGEEKKDA